MSSLQREPKILRDRFKNPCHLEISQRSVIPWFSENSNSKLHPNKRKCRMYRYIGISDVFFFFTSTPLRLHPTLISRLVTRDIFYDSVLPDIASRDPEEDPRVDPSPIFNIIERLPFSSKSCCSLISSFLVSTYVSTNNTIFYDLIANINVIVRLCLFLLSPPSSLLSRCWSKR